MSAILAVDAYLVCVVITHIVTKVGMTFSVGSYSCQSKLDSCY